MRYYDLKYIAQYMCYWIYFGFRSLKAEHQQKIDISVHQGFYNISNFTGVDDLNQQCHGWEILSQPENSIENNILTKKIQGMK